MLKITTRQWKKLAVWVSAFANMIVFALVGGYFMLKDEDKEVQRSVKWAFLTFVFFGVFSVGLQLYYYMGGLLKIPFSSWIYTLYNVLVVINAIGEIVVFAAFALIDFLIKPCDCAKKAEKCEKVEDKEDKKENE